MRIKKCAALVGVVSGVVLASASLSGQQSKFPPRTPAGKPDLSGIYEWPKTDEGEKCKCSATIFDRNKFPPFKPGGEAFYESRTGDPRHDEPRDFCLPAGFPSGMLSANAVRFVQNGNFLVMAHEFQAMTRLIPLDGRPHRKGIEPSFYGDPVGHWEGDTLVVETTNFKRWSLDDYFYTNPKEYRMHSDALRTVERISWKDPKTLSYRLTIDDPKIFTAAWSQDFTMTLHPDWEQMGIFEYVCEENNRCPGGKCSK
jgi:hypothetical protein